MKPITALGPSRQVGTGRRSSLLALDPDLGNGLPPELWNSLDRTAQVVVTTFAAGEWRPPRSSAGVPSPVLLIEGLLAREVCIADRCSAELFGAGDIIQPPEASDGSASPQPRWTALSAGRLALLDNRLLAEASRSLPLLSSIASRSVRRGRLLGALALTRNMRRTDERLLFLFTVFALRWGRVRPDGIRLTLPVTHELLARLIGTRRQSVTSTLGELRDRAVLTTLPGGDWLLACDPDDRGPPTRLDTTMIPFDGQVSLLDVDPKLACEIPAHQLPSARRRARTRIEVLEGGAWQPQAEYGVRTNWLGLLVLEGFVARTTTFGHERVLEVLGPGDLIRPWDDDAEPLANITTSWQALVPVRLALLDDDFARRVAPWPQLTAELLGRASSRARWLAGRLAISQNTHADLRILHLFARLASRWGTSRRNGMHLPLPLTHAQVGQLVGIRRPSATVALGALRRQGMVTPLPDGTWLVAPDAIAMRWLGRDRGFEGSLTCGETGREVWPVSP